MNYACTHRSHDSRKGLFSIRLFRAYHLKVKYLEGPGSLQERKLNKDETKLSRKTRLLTNFEHTTSTGQVTKLR